MKAYCLIREQPWYRRDAFVKGLRAAGHEVQVQRPLRVGRDTLLVIWNRYNELHELARLVERESGVVLVAENGYLGIGGTSPKFDVHPGGPQPHHYYAIARSFHNDDTRTCVGATARFPALGVEPKPYRTNGEYVLVCPNRSFGVPGRVMPPDWVEHTAAALRKRTKLPVRVRAHPGNNKPARGIQEDLVGARAVFVWTSSAGVHAIVEGIPTFVHGPYWILKGAAASGDVDAPVLPERAPQLERLAWSQWTLAEVERGDPFRHLLSAAG